MGEVDAAVATLKQALAGSANDVTLNFSLGNILLHKGELDSGFAHLKKVMERDPGYLERERNFSLGTSASDLPRSEMSFRYARLYAAAGNLGKTLEYLENAKKTGFFEWERIRRDDEFAGFRDDPQIKKYFD
jgi:predicted Zn-dependent protease